MSVLTPRVLGKARTQNKNNQPIIKRTTAYLLYNGPASLVVLAKL